jgi:hypothetical protein
MGLVHRFRLTSVCGHIRLRQSLAAIAFVALVTTAITAKADFIESVDTSNCIGNSGLLRNTATKLSASFTCASGASAQAFSDIGSGELGAYATSGNLGRGTGEAEAVFAENLIFLPKQNIPITVSMRFTGVITGGQASGPADNAFVFQAAVNNGSGNFGLTGIDGPTNVRTLASGAGVTSSFATTSTEIDTSLARSDIDITLTETSVVNTGTSGDVVISAFLYAQEAPAILGVESTVDFLDPAGFSFSVPAGTPFSFDGFLEASPTVSSSVPEPSSFLVLAMALSILRIVRRRILTRAAPDLVESIRVPFACPS